jgi:enoyl-CoA hydratase/carnithine racemase
MKTTNWSISRSAVRNRAIVLDAPWSGVNIGRSAMMSVISVEQRGPVTFLAINQPEELNAINNQVAVDLQSALPTSTTRTNGSRSRPAPGGRAFSASADVTDMPELWRCAPTVAIATEKLVIA